MRRIFHIVFAGMIFISMFSCSDFLQKDPPGSPSQAIYWQEKSHFEAALAGTYSVFYQASGIFGQAFPNLDCLTDNANCQHNEGKYGFTRPIAQGDLSPATQGYVTNFYNTCYKGIARAHILMEQLEIYDKGDISASEKAQMMAECKALRGFFYYHLYRLYKEVPLITESVLIENMHQPKASRSDISAQILKDFDEALAVLPDLPYYNSQVTGRMTRSAVQIYKARLLMADGYNDQGVADISKMNEALSILESISGYELTESTRDNFVSSKQLASKEIIFSTRYLAPNRSNEMDIWYGAWFTIEPVRDLVDAFECTDGEEWGISPLTIPVDESLIYATDGDKFDEMFAEREKLFINRDRRLSESIYHSGRLKFPEPEYPEILTVNHGYNTGFSCIKLVQPADIPPTGSTVSDADMVLARYAHVLLMIAEAENEANGPTQKAYNAINQVRVRSAQPELPAGLTQAQFRERVRKEWRVETCFEGIHYFNMKQWRTLDKINGMVDPGDYGYVKKFLPEFYYFPLPESQVEMSDGILTQDPAYIY